MSNIQVQGQIQWAMSCLAAYRILLNIDEEIELVWKRSFSHAAVIYGLLTYGGLFYITFFPYVCNLSNISHSTCMANAFITFAAPAVLLFGLNVMMTSRVYAMYNNSAKVIAVLAVTFVITQALNFAYTLAILISMRFYFSPSCEYYYGANILNILIPATNIANCAYETILFVLVFLQSLWHLKSGHLSGNSLWNFKSFLAIMARDHMFYFSVVFLYWIYMVLAVMGSSNGLNNNLLAADASVALNLFVYGIMGPIMFLSIRRFDARQRLGETSAEIEMSQIQFAALGTISRSISVDI